MSGEDLGISICEHDDTRVVQLTGELDSYAAGRVSDMTQDWLQGVGRLVVNMDELSYIDSAGLSVVVGLWAKAVESGVRVRILCNSARIQRVLEITGLFHLFNMDSTGMEAHELTETTYERTVGTRDGASSEGMSPP